MSVHEEGCFCPVCVRKDNAIFIERVARALCTVDGNNPDAQQSYPVRIYTEGKKTDTGHDTRKSHIEGVQAPPQWQSYTSKAKRFIEVMK